MEVLDPGHKYKLSSLDGEWDQVLTFVKREGEGYPGNVGHYPGTTMQDVLRCLIQRLDYVNNQIPAEENVLVRNSLAMAIYQLERRAARRHQRAEDFSIDEAVNGPVCSKCQHVRCSGNCHP